MAERTFIPASQACGKWETLLADALDGLLEPADEARFTAHKTACPACAALYEEARKGREWLQFLSPEPEAPIGLLERILAQTGPGRTGLRVGAAMPVAVGAGIVPTFVPPLWQQPGFFARMRANMQPRLVMTAAMAFFSIALTLNVTGVRLWSVRVTPLSLADLRPEAVRSHVERQFTTASVPIVRYIDNLTLLNEVESRVREMRADSEDNATPQQNQGQPATPGETENRGRRTKGTGDQESKGTRGQENGSPAAEPAIGEAGVLESSLGRDPKDFGQSVSNTAEDDKAVFQSDFARSGGQAVRKYEGSSPWIA